MVAISAVVIGLLVGYVLAYMMGMVSFANVGRASTFAVPNPLHFGLEFGVAAVIGFF